LAALEKVYPCLTCGQEIKLERKDNRWLRWNLDGSAHIDPKKQSRQQPTITSSASTAAATPPPTTAPPASTLERKLDHLIAEVQALRLELQRRKLQ
jgi:hypothetical protein